MSKKRKPFVIIRRSGYDINAIINDDKAIRAWKENNVPLTNPDAEPNEEGIRPNRTMNQAIRAMCLSFAPASAVQVAHAKCYTPEYRYKYGLLRQK